MLKRLTAAYLMTTALTIAPALAQTNNAGQTNNAAQTASQSNEKISTQSFVTKATEGGMFEIESSKIALKKSKDQDVQAFANRMIQDHTKANEKLKSIAKKDKVPDSVDSQQKEMLSKLQNESGSNFADQFKQMQVSSHQQAIDLFQNYAEHGDDQQIKQFADQTLPTLKQHLQMAEQITIAGNGNGQDQQTSQNAAATGAAATGAAATGATASATAQNGANQNYLTQETPGTWRASKVIGLGVYNQQNEKVGDINEVLFDKSGKVEGVVIGVGGFLGIGERSVAVPYGDLQWSMTSPNPAPARTAGNQPGAVGAARAPGLGNPASPVHPAPNAATESTPMAAGNTRMANANSDEANKSPAYPDHAILPNASKDQLKKAPQFNYGSAPK